MKKLLCILLAVFLANLPMSARVLADDLTATPTYVPLNSQGLYWSGSFPAERDRTDGISLPLTALALSMLEHSAAYTPDDNHFVWLALYYVLSLCGQDDERAELVGDTLLLPAECVQDFHAALFLPRRLPPVPTQAADRIRYSSKDDQYSLAVGDMALVEPHLTTPVSMGDKLVSLSGTLTEPDSGDVVCTFHAVLTENDSMFGFSVVDFALL